MRKGIQEEVLMPDKIPEFAARDRTGDSEDLNRELMRLEHMYWPKIHDESVKKP